MALLTNLPTRAPKDLEKRDVKEKTEALLLRLDECQNRLYADGKRSVLVILQGMDASGKDGVIRKVFGRLNPAGLTLSAFKTPTAEEAAHDFLWRVHHQAPAKGMIGIFNRSHYEDVLITRVHGWCDDATARLRFQAINNFEELLAVHNGTVIFKFYLHISPEEQKERLQERIDDPAKRWKYNKGDLAEAEKWEAYRAAYEDVFSQCGNPPWTIVPADQNWYKEYLITKTLVEGLEALDLQYPPAPPDA
ncbi:MAG: polyphosphate kinase [Flaviaesturariibacter sp.]|nr:polyphosphate kinase [Flaviaesturariibacter sp.]